MPITDITEAGERQVVLVPESPQKWLAFLGLFGDINDIDSLSFEVNVTIPDGFRHTLRDFRFDPFPVPIKPIRASYLSGPAIQSRRAAGGMGCPIRLVVLGGGERAEPAIPALS